MSPRPATLLAAALAIGATPQKRAINFSDVVIHESDPATSARGGVDILPSGDFTAARQTLRQLIARAYGVRDDAVVDLPEPLQCPESRDCAPTVSRRITHSETASHFALDHRLTARLHSFYLEIESQPHWHFAYSQRFLLAASRGWGRRWRGHRVDVRHRRTAHL
jgi:hypothetical protein